MGHIAALYPKTQREWFFKKTGVSLCVFTAFSLLSSCGEAAEPTRQTEFLLSKEAMIYSYRCDAPMLETWGVGKRVDSIEEIPTLENSKAVACVAINGDETPSSSLSPEFIQDIYNRISKGNSALFLYHFVDVSFLKGTPFRYYYFGKTGEYRAAYSVPVHFYNYGATKGYHYVFSGGSQGSTSNPEYEDAVTNWFYQALYSYYSEA